MKKLISTLSISAGMVLFLAFTAPVKTESFKVDTASSSIDWIGRKLTGEHTGKIKLASGELLVEGNSIKGGAFVMDMNSLTSDSEKLTGHLKTDDFFSVEKNPTAKFQITKVSQTGSTLNVSGNLTIKGITQPISFPATVTKSGNSIIANAKGVKVNRVKFDIRYGSKSFFNDIGDKAIDDDFELEINLVAKK